MGLANVILDNLIAQGKAKPMIVVMPYGHVPREIKPEPVRPGGPAGERFVDVADVLEMLAVGVALGAGGLTVAVTPWATIWPPAHHE